MTLINKKQIASDILSRKQIRSRMDFLACAKYAEKAMSSEKLRILYELFCPREKSPYYAAFDDARNAPVITDIDVSNYTGKRHGTILISATDDFQVDSVRVTIFDSKNNHLEEGEAVADKTLNAWVYKNRRGKLNISGIHIQVTAFDIPGNVTTMEKIIE